MFGRDHNTLNIRHHLHINAFVAVFTGGRDAVVVRQGGNNDGVSREGAFDTFNP